MGGGDLGVVFSCDVLEGGVVVVDDGLLGDGGVLHGHAEAAVAEELHDGDQAEAGVEQFGGVGVTEAMGDDGAGDVEAGGGLFECLGEEGFELVAGEVRADQELGVMRAVFLKCFEHAPGLRVEGDESLVVELAEGDLEKDVVVEVGFEAVGLEADELADADAGAAHEEEGLPVDGAGGEESHLELSICLRRKRPR